MAGARACSTRSILKPSCSTYSAPAPVVEEALHARLLCRCSQVLLLQRGAGDVLDESDSALLMSQNAEANVMMVAIQHLNSRALPVRWGLLIGLALAVRAAGDALWKQPVGRVRQQGCNDRVA